MPDERHVARDLHQRVEGDLAAHHEDVGLDLLYRIVGVDLGVAHREFPSRAARSSARNRKSRAPTRPGRVGNRMRETHHPGSLTSPDQADPVCGRNHPQEHRIGLGSVVPPQGASTGCEGATLGQEDRERRDGAWRGRRRRPIRRRARRSTSRPASRDSSSSSPRSPTRHRSCAACARRSSDVSSPCPSSPPP